jgi:hypothetical protein
MPTWRCPHCRTVQADSIRCFLCGRAATSCGTCASFRRSVVDGLGFCGNDRSRSPLTGEEHRQCWTGASDTLTEGVFAPLGEAPRPTGTRPLRVVR